MWVADHIVLDTTQHQHDFYQLVYCSGGYGEVIIDDKAYPTVRGNAYLVPPMMRHGFNQLEGMRLIEAKFFVTSSVFDKSLRQLPLTYNFDESDAMRDMFNRVVEEGLSSAAFNREATDAALTLLLVKMMRSYTALANLRSKYIGDYSAESGSAPIGDKDADFLRVIDYIERHLSEQITLDDLTRIVHFDKSYLIVHFKEKYRMPPMKYVNMLRIERAKVLLSLTDKSITEIALEVGFGSVHYFSRFFKEKEKVSPNDYRLQRQGEHYANK